MTSNNIISAAPTIKVKGTFSPHTMQEAALARNTRIREGSAKAGVGTKPATFKEISRAPKPSKKGSCVRRRAGVTK